MDEDLIKKVASATGITQAKAKLVLQETNNNISAAIQKIKNEVRNITVLFGSFSGNNSKYSGAFFIAVNGDMQTIERIAILISYSKGILLDFEIDDWEDFEAKLYNKKLDGTQVIENMSNETEKFFNKILMSNNYKARFFDAARNNMEKQLSSMLNDLFSKAVGDISVNLNLNTRRLSMTEFNKEVPEEYGASEPSSSEEISEQAQDAQQNVFLKAEMVISPISGVLVKDLGHDDTVFLKIVDSNDVKESLLSSIGAYSNGEIVPITGTIEETRYAQDSERYEIVAHVKDNIYTRSILAPSVKVKVLKNVDNNMLEAKPSSLIPDKFSVYFIIGGVALIVIVIIIALYLFSGLFQ